MRADDKVNLLRAALISMLPQLRLADMHLGLMNHVSLENKARVALDRSVTCDACLDTGAVHCADPSNCGGPWDARVYEMPVTDCEGCMTADACAIRGQCAHYLRERSAG